MIEKSLPQTSAEYPGQNVAGKGSLRDMSPEFLAGDQQEIKDVVLSLGSRKCRAVQFVQRFSEPLSVVGLHRIYSIANHRLKLRLGALPSNRIARMIVLHPDGPDTHTVGVPLDLLTGRTVEILPKRKELIELLEADCRLINLEHGFSCGRDFFRRRLTQEPRGRGISDDARAALLAIDGELGELTRQGVLRSRCELLDALREAPGVRHVTAFYRKVKGFYGIAENECSFEFLGGKYSSDFPWSTAAWLGDKPASCRDIGAVAAELAELRPRVAALAGRWAAVGPRVFGGDIVDLPPGFSGGVRAAYERLGGASRERVFLCQNTGQEYGEPWPLVEDNQGDRDRRPGSSPDVRSDLSTSRTSSDSTEPITDQGTGRGKTAANPVPSKAETAEAEGRDGASGLGLGSTDRVVARSGGSPLGANEARHAAGDDRRARDDHRMDSSRRSATWGQQHSTEIDYEHARKLAILAERRGRLLKNLRSVAAGVRRLAQGVSNSLRAMLGATDALHIAVEAGQQGAQRPFGVRKNTPANDRGGFDLSPEPMRRRETGEHGGAVLLRSALAEFAATVADIERPSALKVDEQKSTQAIPPRPRGVMDVT